MDGLEHVAWNAFASTAIKEDMWTWLHPHDSSYTFHSTQHNQVRLHVCDAR